MIHNYLREHVSQNPAKHKALQQSWKANSTGPTWCSVHEESAGKARKQQNRHFLLSCWSTVQQLSPTNLISGVKFKAKRTRSKLSLNFQGEQQKEDKQRETTVCSSSLSDAPVHTVVHLCATQPFDKIICLRSTADVCVCFRQAHGGSRFREIILHFSAAAQGLEGRGGSPHSA